MKPVRRKAITETLLELAKRDPLLYALASDSRGSVTLDDFAKQLPGQFVECGIAEQDAVGIAAGLACAGLKPFVCGPASFYATRAAEQVKVDVAYSHLNVKIIGVSGGVSYGALGGTHHSVQDIALMRAIPEPAGLFARRRLPVRRADEGSGRLSRARLRAGGPRRGAGRLRPGRAL